MDAQKVDMFIVTNGKFFRPEIVPQLREKLLSLDESKWVMLQTIQFKDPTTSLIISLLGGDYLWWIWNLEHCRLVLNYGCYKR